MTWTIMMHGIPARDEPCGEFAERASRVRSRLAHRAIILVGMMGAGKSSIGRRLAAGLDLPFNDADSEIERAAGMSIEDMFREQGETYFREGEERVIKRLLQAGPQVMATGGGAILSAATRAEIAKSGLSIWLNAPLDLLLQRVSRRDNRPLLKTGDPYAVLARLLADRTPYYAGADIVIESRDAPHDMIVAEILAVLDSYLDQASDNESGADREFTLSGNSPHS